MLEAGAGFIDVRPVWDGVSLSLDRTVYDEMARERDVDVEPHSRRHHVHASVAPPPRRTHAFDSSYCSRECQRIHWKEVHKHICKKIGKNDPVGDYVDVDVANEPLCRLVGGGKMVATQSSAQEASAKEMAKSKIIGHKHSVSIVVVVVVGLRGLPAFSSPFNL